MDGTITPASDQGLYSADTRCLSGYQLFINGKSWTLLNSGAMAYFADVFEVKAKRLTRRGHIESVWNGDRQELATRYANRDFRRCLIVRLECSGSKAVYANGRISFEIVLPAGGAWHTCCKYNLVANDTARTAAEECGKAYDRLESAHSANQ